MPSSAEAITYVAEYLADKSYVSTLRVEVHADSTGAAAVNQTLTEQRALAVARALVAKGVDCKRLIAVGFGSSKPVADNGTEEGRAANRRTVFENAALRGHAIGGAPLDGGGKVAGDPCTGS
jgi:OOP family OmpA-OmpF porin